MNAPHLALALRLANAGIAGFQVDTITKKPRGKWREESTCDPDRIRELWSESPGAGVGVDLAKCGLVVVDADRHHGAPDGVAAFAEIARAHGGIDPDIPVVETPSGGIHYYFLNTDPPLGNAEGELPSGVNIRGSGGYVVAPGTVRPHGRAWRRAAGSPDLADALAAGTIPPIPNWLVGIIRPPRIATPLPPPMQRATPSGREEAYARAALEGECAKVASTREGRRNNVLNVAAFCAGQCAGAQWIRRSECETRLFEAAHACGLPKNEVAATIKSGMDAGEAKPRGALSTADNSVQYAPWVGIDDDGNIINLTTGEILHEALRDDETAAPDSEQAPSTESQQTKRRRLSFCPVRLSGKTVPPRRSIVPDWLPVGVVTGLYGDGGLGKSLLAQQLQTATALGSPWIGLPAEQCVSLGIYCEDSHEELWRRQADINAAYGSDYEALTDVHWINRLGDDNLLMTFANGKGELTKFHGQLMDEARDLRARLVIVDTAADAFGGNENDRGQVRQFISRALGSIALAIDGAVLLCAHPSRSGLTSGEGDGGSTAWSNSLRSRLFLRAPSLEAGEMPDANARLLQRRKANYAARNSELKLRWENGVIEPESIGAAAADKPSAEVVFLSLLDKFVERPLSENSRSGNYAPRTFNKLPSKDRHGYRTADFERALQSLFLCRDVQNVEYGRASDTRHKIVRVVRSSDPT